MTDQDLTDIRTTTTKEYRLKCPEFDHVFVFNQNMFDYLDQGGTITYKPAHRREVYLALSEGGEYLQQVDK